MAVLLLLAATVLLVSYFFLYKKRNLSTGPWGFPILGHLPLLGLNPSRTLMKWKNIYGPIYFIRFGSIPTVIVSEASLIKEILNLNATAGRPLIPFLEKITNRIGIGAGDGPMVMEQRRFVLKTFKDFGYGSTGMELRIQDQVSVVLNQLQTISQNQIGGQFCPINFFTIPVINSLWDIVIGRQFNAADASNRDVQKLIRYIDAAQNLDTTSALAFFVPRISAILSYFGCNNSEKSFLGIYSYIKDEIQIQRNTWIPGHPRHFTDAFFDKTRETTAKSSAFHQDNRAQAYTTGDIFTAGMDTVSTTLEWLMLYMGTHQKVQEKLQMEIDFVMGAKSPALSDRPQLNYCQAVIQELLRITSILPLAIPHRAMEDFTFHGHKIVKNSLILCPIYGIHHDPVSWHQPDEFRPERFLDIEGKFLKGQENYLPFGCGKRMCLGESLAKDDTTIFYF